MTFFRDHFDGKVLIPGGPVALPIGQELEVQATPLQESGEPTLLQRLAKLSETFPPIPNAPTEGESRLDHYLYRRLTKSL